MQIHSRNKNIWTTRKIYRIWELIFRKYGLLEEWY